MTCDPIRIEQDIIKIIREAAGIGEKHIFKKFEINRNKSTQNKYTQVESKLIVGKAYIQAVDKIAKDNPSFDCECKVLYCSEYISIKIEW